MQKICNGDFFRPIKVEIWDFQASGAHNYICEGIFSLNDVTTGAIRELKLKNVPKKKDAGVIVFEQVMIEEKPDFFDYLRGGCQLNLMTAIDFTGENYNLCLKWVLQKIKAFIKKIKKI